MRSSDADPVQFPLAFAAGVLLARHVRAAAPSVNRESCASMDAEGPPSNVPPTSAASPVGGTAFGRRIKGENRKSSLRCAATSGQDQNSGPVTSRS